MIHWKKLIKIIEEKKMELSFKSLNRYNYLPHPQYLTSRSVIVLNEGEPSY